MLMMIVLAIFYTRFRALPNTEQLFHGFNAAVVALIAVTAWRMGKHTISKPWQRILIVLAFVAVVVLKATVVEVILLSGVVGVGIESFTERRLPRLERIRGFASRRQRRIRRRLEARRAKPHEFYGGYLTQALAEERLRRMSEAPVTQDVDEESSDITARVPTRGILLFGMPILTKLGLALSLSFIFLRVGTVTFGGGFVMIPQIETDVVEVNHWLTHQAFADGMAFGQITPGPVLITATFIGYKVAGVIGALAATISAFLPSFLMTIIAGTSLNRFRTNHQVQAFLAGVAPAVVGMLAAAGVSLAKSGLNTPLSFGVATLAFLLMLRAKLNPVVIVFGCGLLQLVVSRWLMG